MSLNHYDQSLYKILRHFEEEHRLAGVKKSQSIALSTQRLRAVLNGVNTATLEEYIKALNDCKALRILTEYQDNYGGMPERLEVTQGTKFKAFTEHFMLKSQSIDAVVANARAVQLPTSALNGTNAPSNTLLVKYSNITCEVLLNDLFYLSRPKVGSEQQQLFAYLYKHPNTTHTASALKAAGVKFSGEPSNFVRDMGFVGDLAKIFFSTSNKGFMFRNPVTPNILQEMGIKHIRLRTK